jgi:hypothetical protein
MQYDRQILAYHGCDVETAQRLLDGEPFLPSENDYDWLGRGVYFWEYGPDRALRFAKEQRARGKVNKPAVVGAIVQLGKCFDLLDTRFTSDLVTAVGRWEAMAAAAGIVLPKNTGRVPDRKLRRRDCAFVNWYLDDVAAKTTYDTVRGAFVEGDLIYEGSGIFRETHVQIAVRSSSCILGVFRPQG